MENLGKFLFNTHINTPSILFGLFTLCVSLLFIKKLSRKEVIILIIPTVYYFFDIIASCITKYAQSDENIWFYNWVLLLELLLYFFVFKSFFQSSKIKRIINIVIVVFTITHVINILFRSRFTYILHIYFNTRPCCGGNFCLFTHETYNR
jgi:hypothetical protein